MAVTSRERSRFLPRVDLFEFHDLDWVPAAVRESVVEVLGTTMAWGGIARALVPAFRQFMARTRAAEVLELCSGSGLTARLLLDELAGAAPRVILTDLSPRTLLWTSLRARRPDAIAFIPRAVDATAVPDEIGRDRPRLMLNAFHHFPPRLARAVLADAHRQRVGIFIAENFGRNPLGALPCGVYGLPAALANPVRTSQRRFAKALLTYGVPVIPLAVAWDGLASSLRVYRREEMLQMTRDLGGFDWQYGSFQYRPLGRGWFFYGVPRASQS